MPPIASSPGFEPLAVEPLLYALGGVALLVAMGALASQRGRIYSASVIYLGFGVIVAVIVELLGVRWIDPLRDSKLLEHASELAVIVALFATGLALERPLGLKSWGSTWRLLGIVMPLSILALGLWAHYAMGLSVAAAIVLAAALSPTDPVLAGDLGVGPPGEPDDDEVQFALTSEAGFNDGLAFPFVMLGLLLASSETSDQWALSWVLGDLLWAIGAALAIGTAVGLGLGRLYRNWRRLERERFSADPWIAIAAVLAVYGITEAVDAYGFIAAFAGGLALGHERGTGGDEQLSRRIHGGAEAGVRIGELALVAAVGTLLSIGGLTLPGVAGWLAAALLLILVRPLATLLALAGTGLTLAERLFIGWFGVRGIGSIYYATFAAGTGLLVDAEARVVLWTVVVTMAISILAHGMTAEAATRRLRPAKAES